MRIHFIILLLCASINAEPAILFLSNPVYTNTEITVDNITLIDSNLTTIFAIHGYLEGKKEAPYMKAFKRAYWSKNELYNYIVVDWSRISQKDYLMVSTKGIANVGDYLAEFLLGLYNNSMDMQRVHIIGVSLGAHVAGCASKKLRTKIDEPLGRITALDPAGPLFEFRGQFNLSCNVSRTDATMVDVTHTNGGTFGKRRPLGTVDFYVDGGVYQPGCPNLQGHSFQNSYVFCSHLRAAWLYNESITTDRFVAFNTDGKTVYGENIQPGTTGVWFLNTNFKYPYSLGDKGVIKPVIID